MSKITEWRKIKAHIHSLDGDFDDCEIKHNSFATNNCVALYKGKKYTAIFNNINCTYYVDDIYGEIKE